MICKLASQLPRPAILDTAFEPTILRFATLTGLDESDPMHLAGAKAEDAQGKQGVTCSRS